MTIRNLILALEEAEAVAGRNAPAIVNVCGEELSVLHCHAERGTAQLMIETPTCEPFQTQRPDLLEAS